jgi:hypothetical protein
VIDRDMVIKHDILRTLPKKLPPNMNAAVTVDADQFTKHFTSRIIGEGCAGRPGRDRPDAPGGANARPADARHGGRHDA